MQGTTTQNYLNFVYLLDVTSISRFLRLPFPYV